MLYVLVGASCLFLDGVCRSRLTIGCKGTEGDGFDIFSDLEGGATDGLLFDLDSTCVDVLTSGVTLLICRVFLVTEEVNLTGDDR